MASLSVVSGLSAKLSLPAAQVLLVGRARLLKALKFDAPLQQKLAGVTEVSFSAALDQLDASGGSVPLHLNMAKLVALPDKASRHNTPANPHALRKELKGLSQPKGVKSLCVVLYAEYEHVMASVAAVAKCFPLFSLKTGEKQKLESVTVEVVVVGGEKKLLPEDVHFLQSLCDSIRTCAKQIDTPCNLLHSEQFAEEAITLVEALGVPIEKTIIKGEELARQGFGGIYSVGKAAAHPPVFACFSYRPSGGNAKENVALVGKGIVFDTGGMQIKGKEAMPSMKYDMGGAAGVLGAFCTLVKAGFRDNLHCLLCIAENSVSPVATRPDDIITMLSGKTVEVTNTDAEGRLVLADGVFYAKTKLHATTIIDMATLTGAQAHATGRMHAAILTNKEALELQCVAAGRKSGDLVHPLPYAPDLHFGVDMKSAVADMANANLRHKVGPPSSIAGLFIAAQLDFTDDVDWLHVDICAPGWDGERGTGYGPALLCALLGSKCAGVEVVKH